MPQRWHHAPMHELLESGAYMVTAGTYGKKHYLRASERLDLFLDELHRRAEKYGWVLQAWAVFSNHYHFVGIAPGSAEALPRFLADLHSETAIPINERDGAPGRTVWFNYWETRLTYEKSYLARLNYVINNPVKHGLVSRASDYPWCSAAFFEQNAPAGFVRTVTAFKTDRVNVRDPFEPVAAE